MKTYFIILCLLISSGLAIASIQTAVSQDKPPHVYVNSYNMNDQASGTHYDETISGNYAGDWMNESLTYSANFYGLIVGTNGLVGAGMCDEYWQQDSFDEPSYSYNETFDDNWVEENVNSVPTLFETSYVTEGSWSNSSTGTLANASFPIYQEHCDINSPSFTSSFPGHSYTFRSLTHRRGAQAVLKLKTGGKATSRLRNLFGLAGSAVQGFPSVYFMGGNWGAMTARAYWSQSSGTNFPSQKITIGSYGNLNSSGVLYKILPDNADVDVTPRVNGSDYYTFNVTPQKYRSYFDLYVQQANPGYSLIFYNPTNDVGHAFWRFRTDAPSDALQYISANLTGFLGQKWGFYPLNGLFTVPGILQNDNSHSYNIQRSFYIGFSDLLQGLIYTRGISNAPPVYSLSSFNCVGAARGAGFAADVFGLPWDESPQNFGVTLIEMYPAPGQTVGPFIDTNDVFYSSAPY